MNYYALIISIVQMLITFFGFNCILSLLNALGYMFSSKEIILNQKQMTSNIVITSILIGVFEYLEWSQL